MLYFAGAQTETKLFSEDIPLTAFPPHYPPIQHASGANVEPPDTTQTQIGPKLSDLGAVLISRHPNTKLAEVLESSAWSVNEEMVPDDPNEIVAVRLNAGDVVAVIPPVSGG